MSCLVLFSALSLDIHGSTLAQPVALHELTQFPFSIKCLFYCYCYYQQFFNIIDIIILLSTMLTAIYIEKEYNKNQERVNQ